MNRARLNFFKLIRLPADVDDLAHGHVSALKQPDRLLVGRLTRRIRALRLGVPFVFLEHFAIGFHAGDATRPVVALSRDAIGLAAVLIDPLDRGPAFGILVLGGDQVKPLRVDACWMAEHAS